MSTRTGAIVSRTTDAMTVAGFRVGWSLIRRMPERSAHALFDRIADLTVTRGGGARLRANYATVRPELDDAALDRLRPDRPFSDLARAVEGARTRHELTVAARALNRWLQETRT